MSCPKQPWLRGPVFSHPSTQRSAGPGTEASPHSARSGENPGSPCLPVGVLLRDCRCLKSPHFTFFGAQGHRGGHPGLWVQSLYHLGAIFKKQDRGVDRVVRPVVRRTLKAGPQQPLAASVWLCGPAGTTAGPGTSSPFIVTSLFLDQVFPAPVTSLRLRPRGRSVTVYKAVSRRGPARQVSLGDTPTEITSDTGPG